MESNSRTAVFLVAAGAALGCDQAEGPAEYAGVVELEETALAFEVGGKLVDRVVERGDLVQRGEPVAHLDDELERAARLAKEKEVEAARSQVAALTAGAKTAELGAMGAEIRGLQVRIRELERDLARERSLLAAGAGPEAAVEDLAARLEEARWQKAALEQRMVAARQGARTEEVQVATAQAEALAAGLAASDARVERHTLYAPATGVVLDVHTEPGEVVPAGAPVVTIGDPAHPFIEVFVPQAALAGIHEGSSARVTSDSLSESASARVEHVYDRLEFTPRFLFSDKERPNLVLRVRVRVDDPDGALHPGTPAFVTFTEP